LNPLYKNKIKQLIDKHNKTGVTWRKLRNIHYGEIHLKKRQRRKELPLKWELSEYDNFIVNIMNEIQNDVHLYYLSTFEQNYFCFDDGNWIVIVGEDGIMDTCMKGKPQNYFINNPGYEYLGKVKDVFS